MKLTAVKRLNPFTLPLHGARLIEASAGTGKTYTLSLLYLRLLLGIGGKSAYPRPLCVKEILVVTFTDTATEELRNRIRNSIYLLRKACVLGKSKDPLITALLNKISCLQLAALHLMSAEQQMDEAAIYTIHGFCHRMLSQNAVEFSMLFQQTLLEDESFLLQQVTADFWRRHCYPLPLDIACIVQQFWKGPENLLSELLPYLQGDPPLICDPPDLSESILTCHKRIISNIDGLKQKWRAVSTSLKTTLYIDKLDRRVYSNKNLQIWIAKIDRWANKTTVNYQIPNELIRFKSSVLEKKVVCDNLSCHKLFIAVESFFQKKFSLRELIFAMALTEIRQALKQEKMRRAEIGFDDLLSRMDQALAGPKGETLATSIRLRYPVAMIDEFQDTDPQQYRIFRRIYSNQHNCTLLLMGDPKQAIYAFRNADIFTYIRARNEVDACYTLDTNWRSAPGMVNAVNQFFLNLPAPFIFKDIPFSAVTSATRNANLRLVIRHQPQPALSIWLQSGASTSVNEYQQCMARQCAITVRDWLHAASKGEAWLEEHHSRRLLQASDITVLVRNRNEAMLVRDAMAALMIPTVYCSNWESVFETTEARDLQWILQAILTPEKNTALRRALATRLIGFNASTIDALNNDEHSWEKRVEEFADFRQRWKKNGILPMLKQMITQYRIAESLLVTQGGGRRLTNVLHLGELLQEASMQLENEFSLFHWFSLQLAAPNPQAINQQLRIESDCHLVQIITVHKSKGLEFPLVCLPFAANFHGQKRPLFHDRKTYKAYLDLRMSEKSMQLAEEERLAEDLRLFYVALTRSIYHCSFGFASLYRNKYKNTSTTSFHLSAPEFLIQKGQNSNADDLYSLLEALVARAEGDIALCEAKLSSSQPLKFNPVSTPRLSARKWFTQPRDPWCVTSYSDLQQHSSPVLMEIKPQLNVDVTRERNQQEKLQLTPHTFPRGALSGTFLHGLFETLNFNQPLHPKWLNKQLTQQGISTIWLPMLMHWIKDIIVTPLDENLLSLAGLTIENRIAELPFYLLTNKVVQARNLDLLCKQYDPLSARCPPLDFPQIQGIFKGFIDLVFRWKGRYFLLDYKTNWLGEENISYALPAIEQAMIDHRYELQYQLYTLALHRFLRHRLVDYNYQRDFGGVYYLFLRGINAAEPGNGIFYCRPNIDLIEKLDQLFSTEMRLAVTPT